MKNHELHDTHLMGVMNDMINTLNVDETVAHSNTIKVVGNGLQDALQTLVEQVPVLNMKVYQVAQHNVRGTDKEVHVVYFTSHLLEHHNRMKK